MRTLWPLGSSRPGPRPGPHRLLLLRREPAPPRDARWRAAAGEPGNRGLAGASRAPLLLLPRAPSRIPSPLLPVGNASPSGRLGVFGCLEKDARKLEQWGEPKWRV